LFSPPPVQAEWVVAAYLGAAHTAESSLQFQVPDESTSLTLRSIAYAGKPFSPAIYFNVVNCVGAYQSATYSVENRRC